MSEINFYQIDDIIVKSVAPLLLKILGEKKNSLIFVKDSNQMKEIDNGLWQFNKTEFIPHATNLEKDIDLKRQPVLISNEENNLNQSEYLVLAEDCSKEFLKEFSRVFYFYDSMMVDDVKKFKDSLSSDIKVNSYKKVSKKWEKFEL